MSKLLIDDKPVMVLPKLAQAIGLNEAIVLQQIHYWLETYKTAEKSDHYQDGQWWVYNSKEEWVSNFPWWSESTIWRALTALRESKVVKVANYNLKGYDRTLWYTIDYAILSEWEKAFAQNDKMDLVSLTSPIPETTTETTKTPGVATSALDTFFGPQDPATTLPPSAPVNLQDESAREAYLASLLQQRAARAEGEPWRRLFDWISHPRQGIERDTLRRVAWTFTQAGIPEPQSDKARGEWRTALPDVYKESAGDFGIIKTAAQEIVKAGLSYWPPHRWHQQIVALKAQTLNQPTTTGGWQIPG